jgi:hypothetical protein
LDAGCTVNARDAARIGRHGGIWLPVAGFTTMNRNLSGVWAAWGGDLFGRLGCCSHGNRSAIADRASIYGQQEV